MIVSNSSVIASGFVSLPWGTENNSGRSSSFGSPTTTDYLLRACGFYQSEEEEKVEEEER